MTDETFICCSVKSKQMIYKNLPGSPAAVPSDHCRLRTCLSGTVATKYRSFLCQRRFNNCCDVLKILKMVNYRLVYVRIRYERRNVRFKIAVNIYIYFFNLIYKSEPS